MMGRLKNAAKMMATEEQAFILQKGTAALEEQPTVFSSSALSFDYPFCPLLLFLPTSSDLCAFLQHFGFSTRKSEPQRAMFMHLCMRMSISTTKSICVHSYPHMPTQKHDRVSINLSVFTHVAKLETIFHLQNTRQHQRMSHPFHLLPLLSVTPASTPCLMDFQMQVHDFFQDLTGIFLCVQRWGSGTEWFAGDGVVERFCIQSRNIFPELVWKRPNVRLHAHFYIWSNKGNKSNPEILLSFSYVKFLLLFVFVFLYLTEYYI